MHNKGMIPQKIDRGVFRNLKPIGKKIQRRPHPIILTNCLPQNGEPKSPPDEHTGIGFLQRPWRRIHWNTELEAVYILAKRNYKVYANIGMITKNMRRFVAILDAGAGSSFIRQEELPQHMQKNIEPLQQQVNIKNETGKPVSIAGTIRLSVQIGAKTEEVQFLVAQKLSTAVILGCDY